MLNSKENPILWVSFPDGMSVSDIEFKEEKQNTMDFIENLKSFLSFNSSKLGYRF